MKFGGFDENDYIYESKKLLDGSTKEMSVNGSSTSVVYSYSPSGGDVIYIDKLTIILQDPGSMDVGDFGSIASLTNGVLIEYQSNGTTAEFANLQDNGDIATTFSSFWGPPVGGESGIGFTDANDTIIATYEFPNPIELDAASSDYFRITIRDNLTSISFLQASVMTRKITG